MQCFETRNSDKNTYMIEYNMWSDNIWRNFPIISPTKSEWMDMPRSSLNNSAPEWIDGEKSSPIKCVTPKKSTNSPQVMWKTPPKSENPSLGSLDSSPRTSTPVSDDSSSEDLQENKDQYECFKVHLHESPKKLKIRGTVVEKNETMISGHIDMKNLDPFSYSFENHYMPHINKCFLNLLINGPTPLICHEHYDPNFKNPYVSNCQCIPICNCRANLATNRNLPIGYKYNDDGFIVPSMPTMQPKNRSREPNCIYTE